MLWLGRCLKRLRQLPFLERNLRRVQHRVSRPHNSCLFFSQKLTEYRSFYAHEWCLCWQIELFSFSKDSFTATIADHSAFRKFSAAWGTPKSRSCVPIRWRGAREKERGACLIWYPFKQCHERKVRLTKCGFTRQLMIRELLWEN